MILGLKSSSLFVTVLLVLVFALPLGLFLVGERNVQTIENRALAQWPRFNIRKLVKTSYYRQLKTYMVERFPFRSRIIRLRGKLLQDYIGDFNNDRIVWGRDDWMFLRKGIHFSCDRPELVLKAVVGMRDFTRYLNSLGKQVVFMIAPNKSTIYPEKVADRFNDYLICENANRKRFHQVLRQQPEIKYIDMFTITKAARKRWPNGIYHWFDVHWDCRGSAILGTLILRDFFNDRSIRAPLAFEPGNRVSDISKMLGRPFKVKWTSCKSTKTKRRYSRVDDRKDRYFSSYAWKQKDTGVAGARHALLIHDSFANGLRRFMPQVLPRLTMYNVNNRNYLRLARAIKAADKVYVEIIERSAFANFARLGHPRFMLLLKTAMRE